MKTTITPDISTRPLSLTVERVMTATPEALFAAWTDRFDSWFAEPGDLFMAAEVDRPYFFRTRREWGSHPHYGRFTELERGRLVEMTWLNGEGGTEGRETLVRVELTPRENGTHLRLTHSGFANADQRDRHEPAWREGLAILDAAVQ